MESLAHAARLIDDARGQSGLEALIAPLGFTERSLALDGSSLALLGLVEIVASARVSEAPGSVRALLVELRSHDVARDSVTSVVRQLSKHAPQLLWLVVTCESSPASITIAAWSRTDGAPLIAAMTTEPGRVVASDAETLCALAAAATCNSDVMLYMRWLDILGRDAITRRFFRALSGAIDTLASSLPQPVPESAAREIALLTSSRLLFLSFMETRGWLDGDFGFLANGFADCMGRGGGYHQRVLDPLFFGTLNTPVSMRAPRARAFGRIPFLNGGLFTRTPLERISRHQRLDDAAVGELFENVLIRYRFTAREDAVAWSQSAIDPEILGRVFESLMETSARKRAGVFYTPQTFVRRVTTLTLAEFLQRRGVGTDRSELLLRDDSSGGSVDPDLLDVVTTLRLLDPACGSGAFLVHALERLARLRIFLGDSRPQSAVRRDVLTRSIFGVDSNPTAVWLCELRLWLSVLIDGPENDPMRITPLPNLDRNIRVGDSLACDAFDEGGSHALTARSTAVLRTRYARSSGRRKLILGRRLDRAESESAIARIDRASASAKFERRELLAATRARDLFDSRQAAEPRSQARSRLLRSRLRSLARQRAAIVHGAAPAFDYGTHFADVANAGGFDVILGNPPWVRIHKIEPEHRAQFRERFVAYRRSAWAAGARAAHAPDGFAGQVDLAALFVERALALVKMEGTIGLLLPSKLWRSLAGGGIRKLVLEVARVTDIEDHGDCSGGFDAAVYPSVLVATRATLPRPDGDSEIRITVQSGTQTRAWRTSSSRLGLDSTPGSPWLFLPPECREAFHALARHGIPLFESALGRPRLGVKTGCNDAFIVDSVGVRGDLTLVLRGSRRGHVETAMLRPLVRGETLTAWRQIPNAERILWTHGFDEQPMLALPDGARKWLACSRRALERRSDARTGRWWGLFRTESASFDTPRVAWSDFGRAPRAAVIDALDTTVPLNTCYSVTCATSSDALAFAAILNSGVAAAWLGAIAEPARGGYHRYMGWTVSRLPIPIDWPRARRILAPVAERARNGELPAPSQLNALVLDAYGIDPGEYEPLLTFVSSTP